MLRTLAGMPAGNRLLQPHVRFATNWKTTKRLLTGALNLVCEESEKDSKAFSLQHTIFIGLRPVGDSKNSQKTLASINETALNNIIPLSGESTVLLKKNKKERDLYLYIESAFQDKLFERPLDSNFVVLLYRLANHSFPRCDIRVEILHRILLQECSRESILEVPGTSNYGNYPLSLALHLANVLVCTAEWRKAYKILLKVSQCVEFLSWDDVERFTTLFIKTHQHWQQESRLKDENVSTSDRVETSSPGTQESRGWFQGPSGWIGVSQDLATRALASLNDAELNIRPKLFSSIMECVALHLFATFPATKIDALTILQSPLFSQLFSIDTLNVWERTNSVGYPALIQATNALWLRHRFAQKTQDSVQIRQSEVTKSATEVFRSGPDLALWIARWASTPDGEHSGPLVPRIAFFPARDTVDLACLIQKLDTPGRVSHPDILRFYDMTFEHLRENVSELNSYDAAKALLYIKSLDCIWTRNEEHKNQSRALECRNTPTLSSFEVATASPDTEKHNTSFTPILPLLGVLTEVLKRNVSALSVSDALELLEFSRLYSDSDLFHLLLVRLTPFVMDCSTSEVLSFAEKMLRRTNFIGRSLNGSPIFKNTLDIAIKRCFEAVKRARLSLKELENFMKLLCNEAVMKTIYKEYRLQYLVYIESFIQKQGAGLKADSLADILKGWTHFILQRELNSSSIASPSVVEELRKATDKILPSEPSQVVTLSEKVLLSLCFSLLRLRKVGQMLVRCRTKKKEEPLVNKVFSTDIQKLLILALARQTQELSCHEVLDFLVEAESVSFLQAFPEARRVFYRSAVTHCQEYSATLFIKLCEVLLWYGRRQSVAPDDILMAVIQEIASRVSTTQENAHKKVSSYVLKLCVVGLMLTVRSKNPSSSPHNDLLQRILLQDPTPMTLTTVGSLIPVAVTLQQPRACPKVTTDLASPLVCRLKTEIPNALRREITASRRCSRLLRRKTFSTVLVRCALFGSAFNLRDAHFTTEILRVVTVALPHIPHEDVGDLIEALARWDEPMLNSKPLQKIIRNSFNQIVLKGKKSAMERIRVLCPRPQTLLALQRLGAYASLNQKLKAMLEVVCGKGHPNLKEPKSMPSSRVPAGNKNLRASAYKALYTQSRNTVHSERKQRSKPEFVHLTALPEKHKPPVFCAMENLSGDSPVRQYVSQLRDEAAAQREN